MWWQWLLWSVRLDLANLTAARSMELRARTELNKAIAELQRATGNTLKANDIETKLKK